MAQLLQQNNATFSVAKLPQKAASSLLEVHLFAGEMPSGDLLLAMENG